MSGSGYRYILNNVFERVKVEEFFQFAIPMYWINNLSIFNSALVYLQRPGTYYVHTEYTWKEDFSRSIKPEASPIIVLQPFGPVQFLYDVEDTYGDNDVEDIKRFFIKRPVKPLENDEYNIFKRIVSHLGIYYSEKPLGTLQYGFAQRLEQPMTLDSSLLKMNPKFNSKKKYATSYAIVIDSQMSEAHKAACILHELGHILCGHLGLDKETMKNGLIKIPDRSSEKLTTAAKEYEAESVAIFICKILEIENNGAEYLKNYKEKDGSIPKFSLRTAIEAADRVLSAYRIFSKDVKKYGREVNNTILNEFTKDQD